jgi:hypothetical protein
MSTTHLRRGKRPLAIALAATLAVSGAIFANQPLGAQPAPEPTWITNSLPAGQVGEPYTVDLIIDATTDTTGCEVTSPLPNGLSFTPAIPNLPLSAGPYTCGTISGTPTDYETRTVSAYITAQLFNGAVANWQLAVNPAPQPTPTRPTPTPTTAGGGSEDGPAVVRPTYTG